MTKNQTPKDAWVGPLEHVGLADIAVQVERDRVGAVRALGRESIKLDFPDYLSVIQALVRILGFEFGVGMSILERKLKEVIQGVKLEPRIKGSYTTGSKAGIMGFDYCRGTLLVDMIYDALVPDLGLRSRLPENEVQKLLATFLEGAKEQVKSQAAAGGSNS